MVQPLKYQKWYLIGQDRHICVAFVSKLDPKKAETSLLTVITRVSRQLNDFCVPILYHDLNLVHNNIKPDEVYAMLPYAPHARAVRILVDPAYAVAKKEIAEDYTKAVELLLKQCSQVTSLSVYYHSHRSSVKKILEKIAAHIFYGNVESIGIYSLPILRAKRGNPDWNLQFFYDGFHFLRLILDTPRIMENLKQLEIVMETMPMERYASIRSKMGGLSTLSIRRAFRVTHEPIGSITWPHSSTLRRLNLIDCANAYAPHIPELVRQFTALKYLMVSTCGNSTDVIPPRRPSGWSTEAGALCQTHPPLEEFHVEHMVYWEIMALGVIPAKKLIITNLPQGGLESALMDDRELFPMVQSVNVEMHHIDVVKRSDKDERLSLEELCRERRWALYRDATVIRGPKRRRRDFAS
jgi:hypothetical protein